MKIKLRRGLFNVHIKFCKIPQILDFIVIRQLIAVDQNRRRSTELRFFFPRFVFCKFNFNGRIGE